MLGYFPDSGGMVSTPIITQLSDLRGRRSSYLIPLYLTVISNFVCVVAPNYLTFLIFRFLAGFGSASAFLKGSRKACL
jgi:predicted MFS family arabinose efflux permease